VADVVAREHGNIHRSEGLGGAALWRLLERCDALRKPRRFELALLACECDARGRLGRENAPYPPGSRLRAALAAARDVDAAAVAAEAMARGAQGTAVGDAIRRARIDALEAFAKVVPAR
jgi:tRNA nucleotidyltransferase (CCA-adding enzyme)